MQPQNIQQLIGILVALMAKLVPILMGLALLGFFWGVVQFLTNPDNEDKREQGKWFMVWGVIALFVMVSVWGLVRLVGRTFFGTF